MIGTVGAPPRGGPNFGAPVLASTIGSFGLDCQQPGHPPGGAPTRNPYD